MRKRYRSRAGGRSGVPVRAHIPLANLAPDLVCLPRLAVVLDERDARGARFELRGVKGRGGAVVPVPVPDEGREDRHR